MLPVKNVGGDLAQLAHRLGMRAGLLDIGVAGVQAVNQHTFTCPQSRRQLSIAAAQMDHQPAAEPGLIENPKCPVRLFGRKGHRRNQPAAQRQTDHVIPHRSIRLESNGVGSCHRATINHMENQYPENDSRPEWDC